MNNHKKRAVQRHIITLALSLILVFTPVTYISANAASSISAADVQTAVNYAVNWYNSGRLYYYYYCQAFVNQVWKESLGLATSRCCAKNAHDVDLVSTSRDNIPVVFNKLPTGNYTYKVTATAVNGSKSTSLTLIDSSFTVGNPTAATENTRTGVVSIPSSWDNLSIRSGPSTNYSIVGSMNQGAVCTVYPDRAQNGWYYVNYNGVTGYASGNCINLR